MKRNIQTILAGVIVLGTGLGFAGCDPDYSDRYPEEYAKVIRIKDAGRQNVTVYSTDDQTAIPVTIQKGGWDPSRTSKATLRAMTVAEFEAYREESALVFYTMMPGDVLSFTEGGSTSSVDINIEGGEGYVITNAYLDVKKVKEFNENLEDGQVPIVPLMLESADSPINGEDNMLFMVPTYLEPTLTLKEPNYFPKVFYSREGTDEITVEVDLPTLSKWDFTVDLDIDKDLLDECNEAFGTSYKMMPEDMYSGYTGPTYAFTPGVNKIMANISVDLSKLSYTETYALPVVLRNCSMNIEVEPDQSALYGYTLCPPKIRVDYNKAVGSDPHAGDGLGVEGLFDGNTGTHYHSGYSSSYAKHDPVYGSYVDVELDAPIQVFAFDFLVRSYYNGPADEVALFYWSDDKGDWVEFGHEYDMVQTLNAANVLGHFGNYVAPEKFTKMRFSVLKSRVGSLTENNTNYWNCAELTFYGTTLD
ncbi:MAG: DUF1735 domain-containing protein [Muribaculaceae bacterium]|nr:DUF1735 domain-containing protein [Muribaculaceae bacterium]MDE5934716.1 DUF1735 domain-containing protein [Muribaculaceae bacterium]MDE6094331.1 DUF1735 domain-containing protein [Muribaculaceae bacterium]